MSLGNLTNYVLQGATPVQLNVVDVLALPFASIGPCTSVGEGNTAAISDSTTTTWGNTVTGGGSSHIRMYCNGTNWTVAAK